MFSTTGSWLGGYSYSPYGEERSTATGTALTTNSLRYIGGYYDASAGLYKLGARYYDASLGRFTQFDPSGQEANPYSYARFNSINAIDPSGLSTVGSDIANGFFSGFFGSVVGTLVGITCGGIATGAAIPTLGASTALFVGCGGLASAAGTTFASLVKGPF